jgi:SNW domain-containing protein 1
MALAAKKEREIREAATLVRAEKAGMVASSISKFNSELRKDGSESEHGIESRRDSEYTGKKRSREERELEEAKKERDALRHQRKREIERDRRMEVAGKKNSKSLRDEERDISEKIALGQAQPSSRETMFDQRLFNQTSGLDTGFGEDDDYNLYDKPLFTDRTAASIYKNVKEIPQEDEDAEVP